jgi:hypothetical protein
VPTKGGQPRADLFCKGSQFPSDCTNGTHQALEQEQRDKLDDRDSARRDCLAE